MEYSYLIESILGSVRESEDEASYLNSCRIIVKNIAHDNKGYYIPTLSSSGDSGIEKTYIEPDVSSVLEDLSDQFVRSTNINEDNYSNCTIEDADENRHPSLYIHASQDSEDSDIKPDEISLFFSYSILLTDSRDDLSSYVREFTIDSSEESSHNVNFDDITHIEIEYSPFINSSDATCYYNTKTPHKIYSNIDDLNAYAERISSGTEVTFKEIMNQDTYSVHYHPSDIQLMEDIEDTASNLYSNVISNDFNDSITTPTKIDIYKDKSEVEMSIICDVEFLYKNSN